MTVLYPGQYGGVCPWPEGCLAHYGSGTGGTPGGGAEREKPAVLVLVPPSGKDEDGPSAQRLGLCGGDDDSGLTPAPAG